MLNIKYIHISVVHVRSSGLAPFIFTRLKTGTAVFLNRLFLFYRDTYQESQGVAAEVSFKSFMKLNTSAGSTDLYKRLYTRYLNTN